MIAMTSTVGRSARFTDQEVGDLMSPGVTCVSEDATLRQAEQAMVDRGVHAVLVVGGVHGTPLGWVTSRGLLGLMDRDRSLTCARDAITEPVMTVSLSASAQTALELLSRPGTTHLLVARGPDHWPIGVLADIDLVRLAAR